MGIASTPGPTPPGGLCLRTSLCRATLLSWEGLWVSASLERGGADPCHPCSHGPVRRPLPPVAVFLQFKAHA